METKKEKRLEIYRQSSDEIKDLYSSVETGRILIKIEKDLGLTTDEDRAIFALAIGDIILGMYKKDSLGQILKDRLKLSDQQIDTALRGLRGLIERIPESPQSNATPPVINLGTLPPPEGVAEQEKVLADHSTLKPLRTFAEDVELSRVHGYGSFKSGEVSNDTDDTPVHKSSQDDVLNK